MAVAVVQIGVMRVSMAHWHMPVPVRVAADHAFRMRMVVMPVVMAMGMFVLQRLVLMRMPLGEVHP